MIKPEMISTKWNPANYKIYVNLGYIFTKMGDLLQVKSTDIAVRSEIRITAICVVCGKERSLQRCKYTESCLSCALIKRNKSSKQRKIVSEGAKQRNIKIWSSEEYSDTRRKILSALRNSGDSNPNWNHNLSDRDRQKNRETDEYKTWRSHVFERDGYVCVICLSRAYLNAHHLEGYHSNKDLRTDVNNGITLCLKCHKEFHRNYAKHEICTSNFVEWWSAKWRNNTQANGVIQRCS